MLLICIRGEVPVDVLCIVVLWYIVLFAYLLRIYSVNNSLEDIGMVLLPLWGLLYLLTNMALLSLFLDFYRSLGPLRRCELRDNLWAARRRFNLKNSLVTGYSVRLLWSGYTAALKTFYRHLETLKGRVSHLRIQLSLNKAIDCWSRIKLQLI